MLAIVSIRDVSRDTLVRRVLSEAVIRNDAARSMNPLAGTSTKSILTGHREGMIALHINNAADVNARVDPYGQPARAVAWFGNLSVVKLLIESGAGANKRIGDLRHYHPAGCYAAALCLAATQGHECLVQLLLNQGANARRAGNCG